jgi:ATP-dependent helicase/nuclease subunit B
MQCWSRRAAQLVYSWARVNGEAQANPSPLLVDLPLLALPGESAPVRAGVLQATATLESCGPDVARPWPPDVRGPGGVGLLQAQSHCPFKATARWRLGCEPLPEPEAGVDPRLHGEIVHAAMRKLWSQVRDSAGLRARQGAESSALVISAVREAIAAVSGSKGRWIDPLAWDVEQERCVQLLIAALAAEAERAPFRIVADERKEQLRLGGLALNVRLDRVDELEVAEPGGAPRRVLIDYKTGKRENPDLQSMRPKQVQLQAYAQLVDGLCAAVTMHLYRGGASWAGSAESARIVPGVRPSKLPWPELQQRWRDMLHTLGRQFLTGVARVDPLQSACQQCEMQLLCRVDAEVLADSLVATENGDE